MSQLSLEVIEEQSQDSQKTRWRELQQAVTPVQKFARHFWDTILVDWIALILEERREIKSRNKGKQRPLDAIKRDMADIVAFLVSEETKQQREVLADNIDADPQKYYQALSRIAALPTKELKMYAGYGRVSRLRRRYGV